MTHDYLLSYLDFNIQAFSQAEQAFISSFIELETGKVTKVKNYSERGNKNKCTNVIGLHKKHNILAE